MASILSRRNYKQFAINLSIFVVTSLIYELNALDIGSSSYTVLDGTRALLNITGSSNARSMIECGIQCIRQERCSHANFIHSSTCEFLHYDSKGTEINLVSDINSMYLCKYI